MFQPFEASLLGNFLIVFHALNITTKDDGVVEVFNRGDPVMNMRSNRVPAECSRAYAGDRDAETSEGLYSSLRDVIADIIRAAHAQSALANRGETSASKVPD